jgi:hypothetical protein
MSSTTNVTSVPLTSIPNHALIANFLNGQPIPVQPQLTFVVPPWLPQSSWYTDFGNIVIRRMNSLLKP